MCLLKMLHVKGRQKLHLSCFIPQADPSLTFEEVYAFQSSLLSAEVKAVAAQTLITWSWCLGRAGAAGCHHSEERVTGGWMKDKETERN